MSEHTLGAAVSAGAILVSVHCAKCRKSKDFTTAQALAQWKSEYTFPEIAQHARCGQCKQEATAAAPHWPRAQGDGGAPSAVPNGWENIEMNNPNRQLKNGEWA